MRRSSSAAMVGVCRTGCPGVIAFELAVGFEDVQADQGGLFVLQGETDEIELHQALQQAAEVGEQSGKMPVRGDRFRHFQ